MKESVVIGDQIATRGTVVKVLSSGEVGSIGQIGRCGLVSIIGPFIRAYDPSELEVVIQEDNNRDVS